MKKLFVPIIVALFIVLSIIFYFIKTLAPGYRLDVLITGNLIMAILVILSFYLVTKQMNERPQAFVRGVMSATLLKLMVCIASILIYVVIERKHIHKPSVFMLLGIYTIYTITETWLLSRLARQK